MKAIKIAHLYPERMSIYGDFGNVLVLSQRMNWRGIKNEVVSIEVGDKLPKDIDMIFIGGGQDKGQVVVAEDLMAKSSQIKDFAESGGPLLSVYGILINHSFELIVWIIPKALLDYAQGLSSTNKFCCATMILKAHQLAKLF